MISQTFFKVAPSSVAAFLEFVASRFKLATGKDMTELQKQEYALMCEHPFVLYCTEASRPHIDMVKVAKDLVPWAETFLYLDARYEDMPLPYRSQKVNGKMVNFYPEFILLPEEGMATLAAECDEQSFTVERMCGQTSFLCLVMDDIYEFGSLYLDDPMPSSHEMVLAHAKDVQGMADAIKTRNGQSAKVKGAAPMKDKYPEWFEVFAA
jgi:hypothetical protein